ncbi:MAG: DUF2071 domain-containing protein [Actinomycetota bacterium]
MSIIRRVDAHLRRRLLITYRLDAEVARDLVPASLRPLLVDGYAVAGICVLGMDGIRPFGLGRGPGLRSENATHRIAVEWDEDGETQVGVFIFERYSSAAHPVLFGGRLFPGVHRRARFTLTEDRDRYALTMSGRRVALSADVEIDADAWDSTLFATPAEASAFYRAGRGGWSRGHDGTTLERVELTSTAWAAEGARLHSLSSSFFESLPHGSAVVDSVLVMRDIPLELSAVPASRPRTKVADVVEMT